MIRRLLGLKCAEVSHAIVHGISVLNLDALPAAASLARTLADAPIIFPGS